jgi:mono/diheme cytochrome c family protein
MSPLVAKSVASQKLSQNGAIGMTRWNKETSLWLARALAICTVSAMLVLPGKRMSAQEAPAKAPDAAAKPWVAPDDARAVKNPVPGTPENLAAGAQTFKDNCMLCHGEKGMGDGPGAKTIKVKPANFTDAKLLALETDGSLFWKMSNGRGPMPSWKDDLSETERWQLVNYIRKLNKDANK